MCITKCLSKTYNVVAGYIYAEKYKHIEFGEAKVLANNGQGSHSTKFLQVHNNVSIKDLPALSLHFHPQVVVKIYSLYKEIFQSKKNKVTVVCIGDTKLALDLIEPWRGFLQAHILGTVHG